MSYIHLLVLPPKFQDDCCAGCGDELKDGQALMALDKQYHVWCFKCRACDTLLHGEYMGKDGHPYCERDYQQQGRQLRKSIREREAASTIV